MPIERLGRFTIAIALFLLIPACIYIPTPELGHTSGRAKIGEGDIEKLRTEKGSITRGDVLLRLGNPTVNLYKDKYLCYGWSVLKDAIFIPYGGSPLERHHNLCMQFDNNSKLQRVEHIVAYSWNSMRAKRDEIIGEWEQQTAAQQGINVTSKNQILDEIKHDTIQSSAEKGYPEAQWRLYFEFGRRTEDIIWLCRSADNGYAKAQLHVGQIYWDSTEIPKHKIKAYVWYRLAASGDRLQENPADSETLVEVDEAIREAVNTLDQDQLVEAYDRYSEWKMGQCELELANSGSE